MQNSLDKTMLRNARPSSIRAAQERLSKRTLLPALPSARLRNYIDQRGITPLYHFNRAADGGPQVLWIRNRPFSVNAHTLSHLRIIDVRVLKRGANVGASHATLVPAGHTLHVHNFLVVCTIVLHDGQKRNTVMGHGPQNTRSIH